MILVLSLVDLIGFGQSDKPKNFGYDLLDQVNKIKKLLYELEIKDLIIIGHSYGGMIEPNCFNLQT